MGHPVKSPSKQTLCLLLSLIQIQNKYIPGTVVVSCGFGIAKSFQDGIGVENFLLQGSAGTNAKIIAQVFQDVLRGHSYIT